MHEYLVSIKAIFVISGLLLKLQSLYLILKKYLLKKKNSFIKDLLKYGVLLRHKLDIYIYN